MSWIHTYEPKAKEEIKEQWDDLSTDLTFYLHEDLAPIVLAYVWFPWQTIKYALEPNEELRQHFRLQTIDADETGYRITLSTNPIIGFGLFYCVETGESQLKIYGPNPMSTMKMNERTSILFLPFLSRSLQVKSFIDSGKKKPVLANQAQSNGSIVPVFKEKRCWKCVNTRNF